MLGTAPPPPPPPPPLPLPMRGRGVPPSPPHLPLKHGTGGADRVHPPPPPPPRGKVTAVYPKSVGRCHGLALPGSGVSYARKLASALWNDEQRRTKGQIVPGPLASEIETLLFPKVQKLVDKSEHEHKLREKTPSPHAPSPPRYGALPPPRGGGAPLPPPPPPPKREEVPSSHGGRAHTPPPPPPRYGASPLLMRGRAPPPTPSTSPSIIHPPPMYETPSLMHEGAPQGRQKLFEPKSEKVQLIDIWKATNTEVMLKLLKIPVPDMLGAVLEMDNSELDINQVENLIKCCPTKEEMELLKNYSGDKSTLGRCEQYFLELMKVPRVESKFRVLSFKMQFHTQITELKKDLNVVKSAL